MAKPTSAIRRGLQLSPNFWLGHYELGRALLNQKRIREAQDSAEHARLLAPGTPIVYRLLANIHLQQKDYPALLQDIDEYLTLDPNSPAGLRAKELRDQIAQPTVQPQPPSPDLSARWPANLRTYHAPKFLIVHSR
jgi:tetratricopeptide (TPR) repeat protein